MIAINMSKNLGIVIKAQVGAEVVTEPINLVIIFQLEIIIKVAEIQEIIVEMIATMIEIEERKALVAVAMRVEAEVKRENMIR